MRTVAIALALTATVRAQGVAPPGEGPRFEVASVKRVPPEQTTFFIAPQGEMFTARNVTVRFLIQQSTGGRFRDSEILGGPEWLNTERYEIVAKTGQPNAPAYAMLRTLLADRFKLRYHEEQRELPIFRLVVARPDGRLGPQLVPSTLDCAAAAAASQGGRRCGMRPGPGMFEAWGMPLSSLLSQLSYFAERRVVDRTQLTGRYDINLRFASDAAADANLPTLFTALQEQLGLKLEPDKAQVPVLVIDAAERPTEN